jgi:hypothetical protein
MDSADIVDPCTNSTLFTVFFIGAGKVSRPRVDLYGTWVDGSYLLQPPRNGYRYQCTLGPRNLEHGGKLTYCYTFTSFEVWIKVFSVVF